MYEDSINIIETKNEYHIIPKSHVPSPRDFNKIYIKTSTNCSYNDCDFCPAGNDGRHQQHDADLSKHKFYYDLYQVNNYDVVQYYYGEVSYHRVAILSQFGAEKITMCASNGHNVHEISCVESYTPLEGVEIFIPSDYYVDGTPGPDSYEFSNYDVKLSPFGTNNLEHVLRYFPDKVEHQREIFISGFNLRGGNIMSLLALQEEMTKAINDNFNDTIAILGHCINKGIHFIIDKNLAKYYEIPGLFHTFRPIIVKDRKIYIDIRKNTYSAEDFSGLDSRPINDLTTKEIVADIESRI